MSLHMDLQGVVLRWLFVLALAVCEVASAGQLHYVINSSWLAAN
jgi:hypothetical protein